MDETWWTSLHPEELFSVFHTKKTHGQKGVFEKWPEPSPSHNLCWSNPFFPRRLSHNFPEKSPCDPLSGHSSWGGRSQMGRVLGISKSGECAQVMWIWLQEDLEFYVILSYSPMFHRDWHLPDQLKAWQSRYRRDRPGLGSRSWWDLVAR